MAGLFGINHQSQRQAFSSPLVNDGGCGRLFFVLPPAPCPPTSMLAATFFLSENSPARPVPRDFPPKKQSVSRVTSPQVFCLLCHHFLALTARAYTYRFRKDYHMFHMSMEQNSFSVREFAE